jgi:hypothetical protein
MPSRLAVKAAIACSSKMRCLRQRPIWRRLRELTRDGGSAWINRIAKAMLASAVVG